MSSAWLAQFSRRVSLSPHLNPVHLRNPNFYGHTYTHTRTFRSNLNSRVSSRHFVDWGIHYLVYSYCHYQVVAMCLSYTCSDTKWDTTILFGRWPDIWSNRIYSCGPKWIPIKDYSYNKIGQIYGHCLIWFIFLYETMEYITGLQCNLYSGRVENGMGLSFVQF